MVDERDVGRKGTRLWAAGIDRRRATKATIAADVEDTSPVKR